MKIKLSIGLLSISAILSGCMASSGPHGITGDVKAEKRPIKTLGDGSHIKELPLSRDFIIEDPKTTSAKKGSNAKIDSIKPDKVGTIVPRAVVLLDNNPLPFNWNVRRKNILVCEGFMSLPPVEVLELAGKNSGDEKSADRKNHLITYMPALELSTLPKTSADCPKFITKGYDFVNSKREILFLASKEGVEKIGKSPYIAIYESEQSPYSSMILSLGELNPSALKHLTGNWPELLVNVYNHGDNLDDFTIGIATMLQHDEALRAARSDGQWENMQIFIAGATCGGALAGTTVTLNTLLATPACVKFYNQAKEALGYS